MRKADALKEALDEVKEEVKELKGESKKMNDDFGQGLLLMLEKHVV